MWINLTNHGLISRCGSIFLTLKYIFGKNKAIIMPKDHLYKLIISKIIIISSLLNFFKKMKKKFKKIHKKTKKMKKRVILKIYLLNF